MMSSMEPGRPWYDTAVRWGQTNLVEADPARFDLDFWRGQWRRTHLDGIIINCGGIAAYYPSEVPHHVWAPGIEDRDLFGEIVEAARTDGLAVLARMDSNRGDPEVYAERPDWFCAEANGQPMMRGDKHATCISTSYYDEFIPSVMTEVIERYAPDGFADNGWAGMDRTRICHCSACTRSFGDWEGELPRHVDWDDPMYRSWIRWSYARRTELWENNNKVTQSAGGADCRWLGLLHGQLAHSSAVFQDVAAIAERTPVLLLDHQRRHGDEGFEQNAEVAKRMHSVLSSGQNVLECTAMYDMGYPAFRLSSMPAAEVALWLTHGWAGGTQPWWHHIGSVHDDRRQYDTSVPWFSWHREHAHLLTDRQLLAEVGVVWSQQNLDFYGREDPANRVTAAYAGITRALTTQNLLFTPVHVDRIAEAQVRVLILPDIAVLTDAQADAVRDFAASGGAVFATGDTSLRDGDGIEREDFALADLFGAHATGQRHGGFEKPPASIEQWERHSYLRLNEDELSDHPVFSSLEDTRTISFGGTMRRVIADVDRDVLLTWVPAFPIFPPEIAWMRTPRTNDPALITGRSTGGRVAFLPADLDRCAHREEQPDHAVIIGNVVRWLLDQEPMVQVSAPSPVATNLYRTAAGFVLHVNSLLYDSKIPGRQARITPYGPVSLRIRTGGAVIGTARAHVAGADIAVRSDGEYTELTIDRLEVHEVVELTTAEP